MKELEDMIEEIKTAYNITRKEKCENCRYRKFAKEMNKLNYSQELLEELKQEITEQHDYEKNRWTKIFKPFVTYIGAPSFATYITNWCYNQMQDVKDFWLGLLFVAIVFALVCILFGSIVATVLWIKDCKNIYKIIIRFLQKYIREMKLNCLLHTNESE